MNGSILYFITLSERTADGTETFINSLIVFLYIQRERVEENNASEECTSTSSYVERHMHPKEMRGKLRMALI